MSDRAISLKSSSIVYVKIVMLGAICFASLSLFWAIRSGGIDAVANSLECWWGGDS